MKWLWLCLIIYPVPGLCILFYNWFIKERDAISELERGDLVFLFVFCFTWPVYALGAYHAMKLERKPKRKW